jgi:hypothetical protein
LKESFPELFCLARNRDAMVAGLRSVSNDKIHWDIHFTKFVHDWKVGQEGNDRLCWTPSKRRPFKVFTRFFFLMLTPLSLGRAFGGLRLI